MGILGQRLEIADAIITGTRRKDVVKGQHTQRGVAAGAAATDRHAPSVHSAASGEVPGTVDAILDIDDAPPAAQPFAIEAPIACAPAVIYIENSKPAARPILNAPVERR